MKFVRLVCRPRVPGIRLVLLILLAWYSLSETTAQIVPIRVVAANLTSGNNQRYEDPGLRILKGLKPDVVAIQEFNYASTNGQGINTPTAFQEMVFATFGTNFVYYREPGYSIPNGIISRWPIVESNSWVDSDAGVNDRGFAWARIGLPGTNRLYVISVHLKAGSSDVARRAAQAAELKDLITTNLPPDAWIIVAGDMNFYSDTEMGIVTFKSFLSDSPVPEDGAGDSDTNAGRTRRYDRVLVSFSLTNALAPVQITTNQFPSGLVFDSEVYANLFSLINVSPAQSGDSYVSGMQHMAVVKDFNINLTMSPTNPPAMQPILGAPTISGSEFRFQLFGSPGTNYVIQYATNLSEHVWTSVRTGAAPFLFVETNAPTAPQKFYRGLLP